MVLCCCNQFLYHLQIMSIATIIRIIEKEVVWLGDI